MWVDPEATNDDTYVDWTGLDGYNWGTDKGAWQTFSQVFGGTLYGGYNKHDSYHQVLAVEEDHLVAEIRPHTCNPEISPNG